MPAAVSPITRQTVGRTFIIAISVLGVAALGQIVAVGWLFVARFHTTPPEQSDVSANPASPTMTQGARDFTDPFADASNLPPATVISAPAPSQSGPPAPPKPSPMLADGLSPVNSPPATTASNDRFTELLDQGRLLRDRGDTYAAITKLREAQRLDPMNPEPLFELATTYEKMKFEEKASEYWKQIFDMGPSAGVFYTAAEAKRSIAKTESSKQARPAASPSDQSEVVGLGPTSKLGLVDISRSDEADPRMRNKFVLHVQVKAKPRARIDAHDVAVLVQLYDVVNSRTLDINKSDVMYHWLMPPADWSEKDVETLEVTYAQPMPPQGEPLEDRKYYGYIVSVYYKNALQDYRSDPARLAQQARPSQTLAHDPAQ